MNKTEKDLMASMAAIHFYAGKYINQPLDSVSKNELIVILKSISDEADQYMPYELKRNDTQPNNKTDIKIHGPGSLTCDRAGPVSEEDCKTCYGTGTCMYGK